MKIYFLFFLFLFVANNALATDVKQKLKNEVKNFENVLNKNLDKKIAKTKKDNFSPNNTTSPEYYKKLNSIFFNDKEILIIQKILSIYNRNVEIIDQDKNKVFNEDNSNAVVEELHTNELDYFAFVIYLKSIIYESKDNWAIWLNDRKITNSTNNPNNEFSILEINDKMAKILWSMSEIKWEYVNDGRIISEDKYSRNLKNNEVDLVLTLYLNQSYLPFLDKVIEGKLTYNEYKKLLKDTIDSKKNIGETVGKNKKEKIEGEEDELDILLKDL